MNKLSKTLMLGAVALAVTGTVFAKGFMGGNDRTPPTAAEMQQHMDDRRDRLFKLVDATDTQKAQIKSIMSANQGAHEAQFKQMQELHTQAQALRDAKTPMDSAEAKALRLKMFEQREQAVTERAVIERQVNAVLTPEQVAKLDAEKAKHQDGGKGGKGDHGGHGGRGMGGHDGLM